MHWFVENVMGGVREEHELSVRMVLTDWERTNRVECW